MPIEKIHQRMQQILVHSCIYYEYDMNIVPDWKYDQWGNELLELLKKYPQAIKECEYGSLFVGYTDCASGFNLQYRHPKIREKANYLLKMKGLI